MAQLVGGGDGAQGEMSQNLEEIAAYLHDILEERHSVASNVRLLTEVLDSIKRELTESSTDNAQNRTAA
jgi:DNA-binding phage protein